MDVSIKLIERGDVEACGHIFYDAFTQLTTSHGFPADFQNAYEAIQVIQSYLDDSHIHGVVAKNEDRILGSGFLHKRDAVYAIGPISVDPLMQKYGIGRKLTQALIDLGKDASSIRLLQDTFNVSTIGMYTSLGFNVTQPLLLMQGKAKDQRVSQIEVRPFEMNHLDVCAKLCKQVLGFERTEALLDSLKHSSAFVAFHDDQLVAYASAMSFWQDNHCVAITDEAMCALICGVGSFYKDSLSFLVPTMKSEFLRWCLNQGFRGLSPRTQMVMGQYQQPQGCYLPSALY